MTVCHFSDDETEKHFVGGAVGSPPSSVLVVEEIPKLGSGKTDFGATKKIALVNDQ